MTLLLAGSVAATEPPLSVQAKVQTAQWSKNWWMPRHNEKLALKQKMKSVDLVFLGDSITHAFDNTGKQVWQQYYQPRNALNIGFSGDRTENVLWRLENGAVDNIDPKLLVLMIGTNNTGHRQDKPEDTALGIKAILASLENKLPKTKILLLAIFPRGATTEDPLRKINDDINDIIKSYDDGDRVYYLDINHIFVDEKGNLSTDVMSDLLHPNKSQYQVWADAIEPSVAKLMAD
ncbi:platelet-activating factor acetylhydrolase IB subunit [Thalassotalea crassostreae]|uniref:platelet-activating factor acetylhydrolase IB subunit n=1 Tax=Thalassotalea crassostreae TaxID=1763536 RepID=UPI001D05B2AC|nr:platelet-activating factor acetylhydrolase IB subunit [Thalassotalea crassostreae]